jgi:hypothetical protein
MADIDRHIIVVWQSIGVVVGSFAIMALVEKRVLSLDFAASLLVLVCSWSIALLLDANYWYNRNLCIVANIERLFLNKDDLRHVHYYFGKHRPNNKMISTFVPQLYLALGVIGIVLVYHFMLRVRPGLGLSLCNFSVACALPYIVAAVSTLFLLGRRRRRKKDYAEFLKNSPGIEMNTAGIEYGRGHGFPRPNPSA